MSALKASPSLHEDVKSATLTPGYFAVDRRAQLSSASRAVTFGSWPTTMSEICKKICDLINHDKLKFIWELALLLQHHFHGKLLAYNM